MAESMREKVTLMDNLPKVPAKDQIELLRSVYENENESKEKIEKYIPMEKQEKYEKNFLLFDRNNDGILDLD
jgi:Ca2+-binding EF-hand superfamily protein